MATKCKCPDPGAPAWVTTFGDMMSLLLTFFILLLSLSEIKKEGDFRAVVKEVKKAFGMHGGGGRVPTKTDPELTFIERIKALQLVSRRERTRSNTDDPGMKGKEQRITVTRPSEYIKTSGKVTFEPGSAKVSDADRDRLSDLAAQLRGIKTKIIVSGHTDTGELFYTEAFSNLRDLSYARGKAVYDFLVSDACRIRPERIKLDVNGPSERVIHAQYLLQSQRNNRRVEIYLTDQLVEEMSAPQMNATN